MKKLLAVILSVMTAICSLFAFSSCGENKDDKIYVITNAFFAPFEYYKGSEIVGVDVDIMNKVGEKLGKKVVIENADFGVIIESVKNGEKYDCGAAGLTVTESRKEQVDFSDAYFTSVQYVIYKADDEGMKAKLKTAADGKTKCVYWSDLAGKTLGVQIDTTGNIYANLEINGEGKEGEPDYYKGELNGTGATVKTYDDAMIAVNAIPSGCDVVVVDQLPATYICSKNTQYECAALYYDENTATEEQYAICVTKGKTELLNAINDVLKELGKDGIDALVKKHLGLEG